MVGAEHDIGRHSLGVTAGAELDRTHRAVAVRQDTELSVVALNPRATRSDVEIGRAVGFEASLTRACSAWPHCEGEDTTRQIEVESGYEWYDAGDLVFRQGEVERFRLEGVSRPEAFRQVCWKSCQAFVGVQDALLAASG